MNLFKKMLVAVLSVTMVAGMALPIAAQVADTQDLYEYDYDYNYDWDWDDDWNWDDSSTTTYSEELSAEDTLALILASAVYLTVIGAVVLVFYVYSALALSTTAKKLGFDKPWLAWIPIANLYMLFKLGEQEPLLILLFFTPVANIVALVFSVIAYVKVAEKRGFSSAVGLGAALGGFIPCIGTVLQLFCMGYIAWAEPKN